MRLTNKRGGLYKVTTQQILDLFNKGTDDLYIINKEDLIIIFSKNDKWAIINPTKKVKEFFKGQIKNEKHN